jgi:GNAT superfamily N-acetyltransferase
VNIIGPSVDREAECEAVLRSLPGWFGIEEALVGYAKETARSPTFAVVDENVVIGFLTLRQHFERSWEIHCIAIRAESRTRGLGTELLNHAERWLIDRGADYLQVKTIDALRPCPFYAQTREFYARRGFTPLETFPTLWSVKNPALQYVKRLPSDRAVQAGSES